MAREFFLRKLNDGRARDSDFEKAFLRRYRLSGLRWARWALALGGLLSIVFWMVISFKFGDGLYSTARQWVRLLLALCLFVAFLVILLRPRIALANYMFSVGLPMGVVSLAIGLLAFLPPDADTAVGSRFGMAMLLCCWLVYGFARLPIASSVVICGLGSSLVYFALLYRGEEFHIAVALYLLVGNAAGVAISVGVERRERRLYYAARRLLDMGRQLLAALSETREASRAKSHVLKAVAHDLQQPISSMALFLGLLESEPVSSRAISNVLGGLQGCIKSLQAYMARMSSIVHLERGDVSFCTGPVSLEAVLRRLYALHSERARCEGVDLKLNVRRACDVYVRSNEDRLVDVLSNLVSNSIKFKRDRVHAIVIVNVRVLKGYVRISVSDNGSGIPDYFKERIFDEFFRAKSPEARLAEGHGLGLAIVKNIVVRLEGHTLGFRSRAGSGSSFFIFIPLLDSVPSLLQDSKARVATCADLGFSGRTIFLGEDDPDVLGALKLTLDAWGFTVLDFSNLEFLDASVGFSLGTIDLILTDYHLPGPLNGLGVIDELRRLQGREIPALVISGHIADIDPHALAQRGIRALEKPIEPGKLREEIENLLAR